MDGSNDTQISPNDRSRRKTWPTKSGTLKMLLGAALHESAFDAVPVRMMRARALRILNGRLCASQRLNHRRIPPRHFSDLTVLHEEKALGATDQRWSMRHNDAGDRHFLDEVSDRFFRRFIEVGRTFVEQEDARLAIERTRQQHALPLPAR